MITPPLATLSHKAHIFIVHQSLRNWGWKQISFSWLLVDNDCFLQSIKPPGGIIHHLSLSALQRMDGVTDYGWQALGSLGRQIFSDTLIRWCSHEWQITDIWISPNSLICIWNWSSRWKRSLNKRCNLFL